LTIGASILVAAVGAALRYAVADHVDNVNLAMIGLILMIAGVVGLLAGLMIEASRRRTRDVVVERRVVPTDRL